MTVCVLLRSIGAQVEPPTMVIVAARGETDSRQWAWTAFVMIAGPDAADTVKAVPLPASAIEAHPSDRGPIGFDIRAFERALRFAGWSRREAVADAGRLARQLNGETRQWI